MNKNLITFESVYLGHKSQLQFIRILIQIDCFYKDVTGLVTY